MSELKLKVLVNELTSIAASKWYDIGIQLDFEDGELKNIGKDHAEVKDRLREMLNVWLKRVDPVPSWNALIDALKAPTVDEMRLAENLEKKYCHGPTGKPIHCCMEVAR